MPQETMPLTPAQNSFLEGWLKRRKRAVDLRRLKPQARPKKDQSPKWSDDMSFEKLYGDPHYYDRVRGVD
jgi:hypothetical protein